MRLFIPDMTEFFTWMDAQVLGYVVMRGFSGFAEGYPAHGSGEDIDLMVEDSAIPALCRRYGAYKKNQGVKCDVHNVSGKDPLQLTDSARGWKNKFYPEKVYPEHLGRHILSSRRLWKGRFYVPSAEAHLAALLYHIAYQRAERSGIHISDPQLSRSSKYAAELDGLKAELGLTLPHTLMDFHAYLKKSGFAAPDTLWASDLQGSRFKSLFLALVCAEEKGEMNLFVIRKVAVRKGAKDDIIAALRKHYSILMVKDIPWMTRLTKSRKMRGGKWKRGGKPYIAVVVFDPEPLLTTASDREVHPHVLNSRQFFKRGLREWFAETTKTNPKENPLHSTDNEAEAISHLPLFFTPAEQAEIFGMLVKLRHAKA